MTDENRAKTDSAEEPKPQEEQDSERYFWIFPSLTSTIFHMILVLALVLITNEAVDKPETSYVSLSADSVELVSLNPEDDLPKLPDEPMSDISSVEIADVAPQTVSVEMENATELADSPPVTNELFASGDLQAELASEIMSGSGADSGGVTTIFGRVGIGKASGGGKRGGGGGGAGLIGKFYDLKQDRNRKKLPYGGGFPEYIAIINRLAAQGFSESAMQQYYQASVLMQYSQLMIPASTPAEDAPKAFAVENEVEPRGWFIHYSGTVIPPTPGEYRFVGFFDDLLIVYVDGKPVLDGSWVPMANVGKGAYDDSLRQEFHGPAVLGSARTAYMGKWIKLSGPTKIDIVIGETPGGKVGGLLMFEQKGVEYAKRSDGTPILPLFSVGRIADDRIRKDPNAQRYGLLDPAPTWKTIDSKELRLR